ncbi:MAG TPA: SDR family oxidoreductase [Burkholderiales bacterium]|jgi:NAD(P)-dependent dehydrogenase (short-subunit alcohol dehydrogenase family)|nr:SDR family oxidoreductase [Burkholderiales bacterium]
MPDKKSEGRRKAFVTGAAHGLGAAIALALARDGFDLAVSSRQPEKLGDVVAQLEAAGAHAVPVALDVRSPSSIERAMAQVIDALSHVDVLINNAAETLLKPAVDVTRDEWDAVMGVNLTGTFFMSQQMGRHLTASGRPGCIISIASTHGVVGMAQRSTYGISKAALIQMTRMLAIEWAGHGIRVNAIAPGTIETPSRAAAFAADPARRELMMNRIPLRRFGTAEEVAGLACYLASPQAAYITGQTVLLDGGLTAY